MVEKERIHAQHSRLCSWLCDAAYPLWSTQGRDPAGGFHERLAQNGEPLAEPRRSRVNPRQVYCFAMAPSLGWRGDVAGLVQHGLDYFLARYRRPDGLFRTLVNADGSPRDDRALLYDQAFALLAFNVAAGIGTARAERERLALDLLTLVFERMKRAVGSGFESGVPATLPLLSNPHMHLFEAALAGSEMCPEHSLWKALGDELAELALAKFIDPASGALREFFDAEWKPAPGIEGRIVEPGHQFEWAWLLLRWGGSRHARDAALKLIDVGEHYGVRNGLATNSMLDDFSPHDAGARLWPQTERIKAAALAARLTGEPRYYAIASAATEGLFRYLDTPLAGLWYDRIDADGRTVDEPAPASSFYHLVAAIAELSALARQA